MKRFYRLYIILNDIFFYRAQYEKRTKILPTHYSSILHRTNSLSLFFPLSGGEVLPATSSPPHLIVFSTLLCLLSSSSSLHPLLQFSHLSLMCFIRKLTQTVNSQNNTTVLSGRYIFFTLFAFVFMPFIIFVALTWELAF